MNEVARDFLVRCFAPGSTIALLLRTESPAKTQQRVVTLEQALAPGYLGWLAYENCNGANVYVAANPLRSGSRRRTKENIDSVHHLYLDIDADGDVRIADLLVSEAVPSPTAILSTSPGKYQALWRVQGFNFESQEATLKLLTSSLVVTQRARTATMFSEFLGFSTASTILPIVSLSNIPVHRSGIYPTSVWTSWRLMAHALAALWVSASKRETAAHRRAIGRGSAIGSGKVMMP